MGVVRDGEPVPGVGRPVGHEVGAEQLLANWRVFSDQGGLLAKAADGLSNTIVFNEKYAVARRPSGNPMYGATLWGYGVDPRTIPGDFTPPRSPANTRGTPSGPTGSTRRRCTSTATGRGAGL